MYTWLVMYMYIMLTYTTMQGAIVGVNVFYFIRIMKGIDDPSRPGGGYASFPESSGQPEGGSGGNPSADYTPPEY